MAQHKASLQILASEGLAGGLTHTRASIGTRVNKIGNVEQIASGTIRYDYWPEPANIGINKGYLLEESSQNVCLQSEAFGTTWVTTAATLSNIGAVANNDASVLAPDGSNNSDKLTAGSSATGIAAVRQTGFTFANGTKYTVSVWAKANGQNHLELSNSDDTGSNRTYAQCFNLGTGATGASGGTVYASGMEEFAGGWYRCWVTFTGATSNGELYIKSRPDNAVSTTAAMTSGNGANIWGAQIEALTYKTSYIPTTTAAVTRAADVASIADTDAMWNWNSGVSLFVDYIPMNTSETVTPIYHYQDSSNANYMTLLSDGDIKVFTASTSQLGSASFDTGMASVSGSSYRSVMTVANNYIHFSRNGVLSSNLPDTGAAVPAKTNSSNYAVKFMHGTGFSSGSGWLKSFRIYSHKFTTADLQNTSIAGATEASVLAIGTSGTVADDTITAAKLKTGIVSAGKIGSEAVETAKLKDLAVTTGKIAADAITGAQIADDAIGAEHIADNSITSAHLALNVILAEDIANNAVTFAELAANAVITAKIADDAVTMPKLNATGTADNTTFLRGDGAWVSFASQETDPTATSKAIPMAIALG